MQALLDEILDYIYSFINLEKTEKQYKSPGTYSLTNIKQLLNYFENPHKNQKIIHVAGTKGKGSTCLFITALLRQCGYTVANFLSPHLVRPNERFLYETGEITDEKLISITQYIRDKLSSSEIVPTTFELFLLIFFLFAKEKEPDYIVLETGLGGRLDCTNIVTPLISVITPISLDHTNILGDTIEKIAREKGGIIKPEIPVVIAEQPHACEDVFYSIARHLNAPIMEVKKEVHVSNVHFTHSGVLFDYKLRNKSISKFQLPVLGKHQIANFCTAFTVVNKIIPELWENLLINKALSVSLPARIQILQNNPPIILDVSHNEDSAIQLCETVKKHFPGVKWNVIAGLALNKDYQAFFSALKPIINSLIITTPDHFKESNPEEVYKTARSLIEKTMFIESALQAFNKGLNSGLPLIVTGSFYISGPFYSFYKKSS